MDTCNICGINAVISECKTCLIKCCKRCFEHHKDACDILKDSKYHRCQYHVEPVKAYCFNCYQLICKECVIDNHVGHNSVSLFKAYHNRKEIVSELSLKQTTVRSYIDACNEKRQKYCLPQDQIEEEEQHFQRCLSSVRDSLKQQVEPNIKQIDDHCKAGDEVMELYKSSAEDTPQCQRFPLIYLAQLSRNINGLNLFEKKFINCDILVSADQTIQQSRDGLNQVFLSKVV